MIDYELNEDAIKKVREIDEKIKEEMVANGNIPTKLMFEQMLRGLYINQFNYQQ